MYSVVLMAAMVGGAETPAWGWIPIHGCRGTYVYPNSYACAGCSGCTGYAGSYTYNGYYSYSGCYGGYYACSGYNGSMLSIPQQPASMGIVASVGTPSTIDNPIDGPTTLQRLDKLEAKQKANEKKLKNLETAQKQIQGDINEIKQMKEDFTKMKGDIAEILKRLPELLPPPKTEPIR